MHFLVGADFSILTVNQVNSKLFLFHSLRYLISSSNNVIGKLVLNEFPYPMTLTMVQLLSISLYSGPLLKLWNIRPGLQSSLSRSYYWKLIVPLAFGKFLSSVFSHVSIWKVPVSFAHTGIYTTSNIINIVEWNLDQSLLMSYLSKSIKLLTLIKWKHQCPYLRLYYPGFVWERNKLCQ